ncbi:hypothetical protein FN846DRAFT_962056 [Sphaerosporella brunnea]|uniref:Uncharacterized protein n=1 Tax=Sphaerosporella brunnea TaxID=1250544 RepID=A0A5J5EQK1_9PEZI|nr:hypothetical protein FN846DRAFT_962056 [Sphaerosporella brunnea]
MDAVLHHSMATCIKVCSFFLFLFSFYNRPCLWLTDRRPAKPGHDVCGRFLLLASVWAWILSFLVSFGVCFFLHTGGFSSAAVYCCRWCCCGRREI